MSRKLLILMSIALLIFGLSNVFAGPPPPLPKPPAPSGTPKPMKCIHVKGRVGLCGNAKPFKSFTVGVSIKFNKAKVNKLKAR